MFKLRPGLLVNVEHGVIGPHYDPYSTQVVSINAGSNGTARYYMDGLGRNKVEFYSDFDDENPARVIEWFGDHCNVRHHRQNVLKANIIARRTMGATFDEAELFVMRMPCDPMGNLSRYI